MGGTKRSARSPQAWATCTPTPPTLQYWLDAVAANRDNPHRVALTIRDRISIGQRGVSLFFLHMSIMDSMPQKSGGGMTNNVHGHPVRRPPSTPREPYASAATKEKKRGVFVTNLRFMRGQNVSSHPAFLHAICARCPHMIRRAPALIAAFCNCTCRQSVRVKLPVHRHRESANVRPHRAKHLIVAL